MPALQWCGRRWMTGSDDFTIMSVVYFFIHVGLGAGSVALALTLVEQHCKQKSHFTLRNSLLMTGIANCVTSIVCLSLAYSSSRGSIFQTSRRWFVPIALYAMSVSIFVLLGMNVHAALVVFRDNGTAACEVDIVRTSLVLGIRAIVIMNFVFPLLASCVMLLHFDTHGKRAFESYDAYEQVWERRCSVLCCCCVRGAAGEEALLEAARTMAILFSGLDIVPSDIAAAFVLLRSYQRRQYNKRLLALTNEPLSPLTATQQKNRLLSAQARRFHRFSRGQLQILSDVHYYSRYYLAAYGWLLFWYQHLITGLPRLWASDCTMCCRRHPGMHVGDCCYCNNAALRKVAGVRDEDVLFTHFKNELYYPCFYVCHDPLKKTVIIAVRGTMSLQDCITDVVAAPQRMPLTLLAEEAFVHSGMLRSAMNIHDALFQHLIIDDVLRGSFADCSVMVVGHSLGAGTATLLTILLHDRYAELRERIKCIAYAPPGGLLSANLAMHSASFVTGVFMGKDLVPRLAAHTMSDLRDSMLKALAATRRSKTTILCHFCCPPETEELLPEDMAIDMRSAERLEKLRELQGSPLQPKTDHPRLAIKLFPPAQMIHYAKVMTKVPCCQSCVCCNDSVYCPSWIDADELQEVLCSPYMVADHMPDRLFACIQRTATEIDSGCIVKFQDPAATPLQPHAQHVSFMYNPQVSGLGAGGSPPRVSYNAI